MKISKKFGLDKTLLSVEGYWNWLYYSKEGKEWVTKTCPQPLEYNDYILIIFNDYLQFTTQPITESLFVGQEVECNNCNGSGVIPKPDVLFGHVNCQCDKGKIKQLPLLKGWKKSGHAFILESNEDCHITLGDDFKPKLNHLIIFAEIEGLELEFNDIEI